MRKNPYPGKFIVIEGVDGSGKSTQIECITQWLKEKNSPFSENILITHEPFTSEFGLQARAILEGRAQPFQEPLEFQELYVKDRKRHLEDIIIPYLRQKDALVLCDRYFLSTFAYGMGQGIAFDVLMELHQRILGDEFIIPDATFIITTDVDTALLRLKHREKPLEYFEKKKNVMMATGRQYIMLAEKFPNTHLVSGNRPIAEVSEELSSIIGNMLQEK